MRIELRNRVSDALSGMDGWTVVTDGRSQLASSDVRVFVTDEEVSERYEGGLDGQSVLEVAVEVALVHQDLDALDNGIELVRGDVLRFVDGLSYTGCTVETIEGTLVKATLGFVSLEGAVTES